MVKRRISMLIVIVMLFSALNPMLAFGDTKEMEVSNAANDYENHWAEDTLKKWVESGKISGNEDGSLKPDGDINRAELIKIINTAFGFTEKAEINFTDVKPGSWYYEEVQKAVAQGYVKGVSDTLFAPEGIVTREQEIVMAVRILGLEPDPEYAKIFTDHSDMSSWALGAIGAALKSGLISGYADGSFKPQNFATRAEVVVTFDKSITKIEDDKAIANNEENKKNDKPSGGSESGGERPSKPDPDPNPDPETKPEGSFEDALAPINRQKYPSEKITAVPLIILMDFPDYKYTDLDKNELPQNRINQFKGAETTPEFYEKLFFGDDFYTTSNGDKHITVNKYYMEQSGGTYELKGDIYGWYTAKKNIAYYGEDPYDQPRSAELVREALQALLVDNPNIDLSKYDVEDKWDIDNDGDYDEPDGIIDTIVLLHAGMGDEWGGGAVGSNAIWPFAIGFSWYNYGLDLDNPLEAKKLKEPDQNGNYPAYRFFQGDKEWFAEDFTVFEQDLPLDLFCHEYGHILGLPDLYSDGTPPVENWSIMGGSYTGNPKGSKPNSYGAVNKKILQDDFEKRNRDYANWQNSYTLDLDEIGNGVDVVLDQESLKGTNKDSVIINLPPKEAKRPIVTPFGKTAYFSDNKDNAENYMYLVDGKILLDAKKPKLNFKAWYDIDPYFDFFTVQIREAKTEDKWDTLKDETGYATDKVDKYIIENETPEQILERNPGWSITDTSFGEWVDISFDLSKYAGKEIELRFRYKSDTNTPEQGIYIDDIKIKDGETVLLNDGSEDPKFSLNDFLITDGYEESTNHYYIMEWRSSGAGALVDEGLLYINQAIPDLTYDPGLILWYINDKYAGNKPDQNNSGRNGEQWAGVVDADQTPIYYNYIMQEGSKGADKVNYQLRDAAFSIRTGSEMVVWGNKFDQYRKYTVSDDDRFMNPVFEDNRDYMQSLSYKDGVECGVNISEYGLKIFVTDESYDRSTAKIHIGSEGGSSIQEQSVLQQILFTEDELNLVTDKAYGDKAYAELIGDNGKIQRVELNLTDGVYKIKSDFLTDGTAWQISFIVFEDKQGNAKAIYNSEVFGIYGFAFSDITSRKSIVKLDGITVNGKVYDKEPIAFEGNVFACDPATGEPIDVDEFKYVWMDEKENILEKAPINAGAYKLKVVAEDDKYFGITIISFVIEKRDVIIKAKDINIAVNEALPEVFELEYDNVLDSDKALLVNGQAKYQLQKSDDSKLDNSSVAGQYYIQITNLDEITSANDNYNIFKEFGYGLLLIGDENDIYPLNVEVGGISIIGNRTKEYDKKYVLYEGKPTAKIGNKFINVNGFSIGWSEKSDKVNLPITGNPIDAGKYALDIIVSDDRYIGTQSLNATINQRNAELCIDNYTIDQGADLPKDKAIYAYYKNVLEEDVELLFKDPWEPKFYYSHSDWDILLSTVRAERCIISFKNIDELLIPNKNYNMRVNTGILVINGDNAKLDERETVDIIGVELENYKQYDGTPIKYTGTPHFELDGKKLDIEPQIVWHNKNTHDVLKTAPTEAGRYELIIYLPEEHDKYVGRINTQFEILKSNLSFKVKDKKVLAGSKFPSNFGYYYYNDSLQKTIENNSILTSGIPEFKVYDKEGILIEDTRTPGEYYIKVENFGDLKFNSSSDVKYSNASNSWGTFTILEDTGKPIIPEIDPDKMEVQISIGDKLGKVYDGKSVDEIKLITANVKNDGEDVTDKIETERLVVAYREEGQSDDELTLKAPVNAGSYELIIYVHEFEATYTGNVVIPFKITPKPLNLLIENKDGKNEITQGEPLPESFDLSYEVTDENVPDIVELPLDGAAVFEVRKKLAGGTLGEALKETYSAEPGEYAIVISNFENIKPADANYTVTASLGNLKIEKSDKIFVKIVGVAINDDKDKTYDQASIEFSENAPRVLLRNDSETEISKEVKLIYTWLNKTTGVVTKNEVMTAGVISDYIYAPKDAGKYKLSVSVDDEEYAGSSEDIEFIISPITLKLEQIGTFTINEDSKLPKVSQLIKFTNVLAGDDVKIIGDPEAKFKKNKPDSNTDNMIRSIEDLIKDLEKMGADNAYYRIYINRLKTNDNGSDMTLKSSNPNYEIPSTDGGTMFDISIRAVLKTKVDITIDIDGTTEEGKIIYNREKVNRNDLKVLDNKNIDITSTVSPYLKYEWFKLVKDGNIENWMLLSEEPKDVGSYKLIVSVPKDNAAYKGSFSKAFEITPKEIEAKSLYEDSIIIEVLPNRLPLISEIIELDENDICVNDTAGIKDGQIKIRVNEGYDNAGSIIETVDEIITDKDANHYILCANDEDNPMNVMTIETTNPNYMISKVYLNIGFKEPVIRKEVIIGNVTVIGDGKPYDKNAVSYVGNPEVTLKGSGEPVTDLKGSDIEYKWYEKADAQNERPLSVPKDAGSYKLVVSISKLNEQYSGELTIPFTIASKELTVSSQTGNDSIIIEKTANPPKVSEIIKFEGVCTGDNAIELKSNPKLKVLDVNGNEVSWENIDDTNETFYILCINDSVNPDKTTKLEPTDHNYVISHKDINIKFTRLKKEVTIEGVTVTGKEYDKKAVNYTETPVIKTADGNTVDIESKYIIYNWYKQNESADWNSLGSGADKAPINAGNYKLVVSISDKNINYKGTNEAVLFTIEPKKLEAYGIGWTNSVTLEKGDYLPMVSEIIELRGICDGDTVRIEDHQAVLKTNDDAKVTITDINQIVADGGWRYVLSANRSDGWETIKSANPNYIIHNQESNGIWLYIAFKDKQKVTITGVTVADKQYDGQPVEYNKSELKVWDGNTDRTNEINVFDYKWYKQDGSPLENEPPVSAGDYYLIVSVSKNNVTYKGNSEKIGFTISKRSAKVKPEIIVVDSEANIENIDEVNLVYGSVLETDEVELPITLSKNEFDVIIGDSITLANSASVTTGSAFNATGATTGTAITGKIVINESGIEKINSSVGSNYDLTFSDGVLIVKNGTDVPPKTTIEIEVSDADRNKLNKTFDGKPAANVTPTFKLGEHDITDNIFGFKYTWKSENGEELTEAPVNAGNYQLIISVSDNDDKYTGDLSIGFTIDKQTAKLRINNGSSGNSIRINYGEPMPNSSLYKLGIVEIINNVEGPYISGVEVTGVYDVRVIKPNGDVNDETSVLENTTEVELEPGNTAWCGIYIKGTVSISNPNYKLESGNGESWTWVGYLAIEKKKN